MRLFGIGMLAVAACAAPASATPGEWSFDFGQGVAEYSVATSQGDRLALSCAEAGVAPGSRSISLQRAGYTPRGAQPAIFRTDRGLVRIGLGRDGWASYPDAARAARFDQLWALLAKSRKLTVIYGPGKALVLPLDGAHDLLGDGVCPKQLAD